MWQDTTKWLCEKAFLMRYLRRATVMTNSSSYFMTIYQERFKNDIKLSFMIFNSVIFLWWLYLNVESKAVYLYGL